MTLDDVLREITQRTTCVDWDAEDLREGWKAPTGEAYIVLCSGGVKKDDEPEPAICSTKEAAIRAWRLALLEYERERPGVLYWRNKPHLEPIVIQVKQVGDEALSDVNADETWWTVYSRLLISGRPAMRAVKRMPRE